MSFLGLFIWERMQLWKRSCWLLTKASINNNYRHCSNLYLQNTCSSLSFIWYLLSYIFLSILELLPISNVSPKFSLVPVFPRIQYTTARISQLHNQTPCSQGDTNFTGTIDTLHHLLYFLSDKITLFSKCIYIHFLLKC